MTGYYGGLNDDFIGIEINNPGKLKERNGKLYTDFDLEVPRDQARYVTYEAHGCPTGWYKNSLKPKRSRLSDSYYGSITRHLIRSSSL